MEDVGSKGEDGRRGCRPNVGVVVLVDGLDDGDDSERFSWTGAEDGCGVEAADGVAEGESGRTSTL